MGLSWIGHAQCTTPFAGTLIHVKARPLWLRTMARQSGADGLRLNSLTKDLSCAGVALIAGALVAAQAAWLHMRGLLHTYGVICGSNAGALAHCPACYASFGLLASGVACLILARAAPDRPVSAR